MQHDPARLADTQTWLAKASSDLRAGAHMLTADAPFTGDAVFHAQQAAEKAFKGFLAWHDVPFGKTHDLARLGHQCAAIVSGIRTAWAASLAADRVRLEVSLPG